MVNLKKGLLIAVIFGFVSNISFSAGYGPVPERQEWSWTGLLGRFDKDSVKRGYKIYREVCSSCHSMNRMYFRNISSIGFTNEEVDKIAKSYDVVDGPNDEGYRYYREGKVSDKFVNPYENENLARAANGGAYPPDLSLIVKSRAVGKYNIAVNLYDWMLGYGTSSGADYVYSLLTGFQDKPDHFDLPEGKYYNKFFPGNAISMAPPLNNEIVEYEDGTPASISQHARDITTFLAWASEPELDTRKNMGVFVVLYLIFFSILLFFYKKKIWKDVK